MAPEAQANSGRASAAKREAGEDKGSASVKSAAVGTPPQATELPLDIIFGLLKNKRRRRVLRYLEEESENVDLGSLAEALAAEELDKPVGALRSDERKRVYISLYQCHLPKLDDAGVIEFESDRGTIRRTERTADLLYYLQRVNLSNESDDSSESSWPHRYVGISFGGGVIYLLQASLFPSAVYSVLMMGMIVGVLFFTSLIQMFGV